MQFLQYNDVEFQLILQIYKISIYYMINQIKNVFVGSYTADNKELGLYNLIATDMKALQINVGLVNPSFALIRNGLIYIVEEINEGRLNVVNSSLQLIKTVQTFGDSPCHISINQIGNRIVVANYFSPTFVMYDLVGGVPTKVCSLITHEGSSVNPDRQQRPHPHCSVFSYDDQVLFVSDLGTDIVYYYSVKYEGSEGLICEKDKCLKLAPGCGPRHLARGESNQKLLYLSCELDSTTRVLSYASGKLEQLSVCKVSENPKNSPAEVAYFNGNVFMANRGDNNIVVFNIPKLGQLKQSFRFKVGAWPRHFKISKSGIIYVTAQHDNKVQIYKYENEKIIQLGSINITTPSVIAFEE